MPVYSRPLNIKGDKKNKWLECVLGNERWIMERSGKWEAKVRYNRTASLRLAIYLLLPNGSSNSLVTSLSRQRTIYPSRSFRKGNRCSNKFVVGFPIVPSVRINRSRLDQSLRPFIPKLSIPDIGNLPTIWVVPSQKRLQKTQPIS